MKMPIVMMIVFSYAGISYAQEYAYSFAVHLDDKNEKELSVSLFSGTITFNAADEFQAQRIALAHADDIRDSIRDILRIIRSGLLANGVLRTIDIISRELPLLVRFQPLIATLIKHKIPSLKTNEFDARALKAIAALSNPNKYPVALLQKKIQAVQPIQWNVVLKHSLLQAS